MTSAMIPAVIPPGDAPLQDGFEPVSCYLCGSASCTELLWAEDDLTGRPGRFRYVTCDDCGLAFQNPRLSVEHIKTYYDDTYIAHRRRSEWGPLTGFFNRVMDRHDRQKDAIVRRYMTLRADAEVLDVGCAVGTFLQTMRRRYGVRTTGVDFTDLRGHPSLADVEFHCGLFYEVPLATKRFDLVTMWHFLEHDYDPVRSLTTARRVMKEHGRLVIEVPRLDSLTFRLFGRRWPGVQAPQHTALYDRASLTRLVEQAGFEVEAYLPYGAFPAFFYFFAGGAFMLLRGRGLNLSTAIYPYFLGQILFSPMLAFEKQLNFAMQTVVCRRSGA